MSKHKRDGHEDGKMGLDKKKPHSELDWWLSGSNKKKQMDRDNSDYNRGYDAGKKDREKRR